MAARSIVAVTLPISTVVVGSAANAMDFGVPIVVAFATADAVQASIGNYYRFVIEIVTATMIRVDRIDHVRVRVHVHVRVPVRVPARAPVRVLVRVRVHVMKFDCYRRNGDSIQPHF